MNLAEPENHFLIRRGWEPGYPMAYSASIRSALQIHQQLRRALGNLRMFKLTLPV